MVKTKIKLGKLTLDNPIIPASGTFGYGKEFSELYDINILGSFSFKGTTLTPRFGNPTPRIAECPSGLINSVGLQNPGVNHVIKYELKELKKFYKKKVIANVSGFSIKDYQETCKLLDKIDQVGIIEVNISCPNVHNGGMAFGTSVKNAVEVTKAVKKVCKKPVFIKLSPNVTDIVEIAKAVEKAGADGLVISNTFLGMRISLVNKKPIIANKVGGYSGPGVFPMVLRMVYQVYENVKIPIIGCGGVSTSNDVIEMMLAGATAVEIGSANLVDPYICKKIITELPKVMKKYKITDLSKIIGGAHHG